MSSSALAPANPATDAAEWAREVKRFVEAGGNTTHAFGLGRLIGRMFALLYLNARPLSLEEIADRLQISKASASLTARQLADWRAVRLLTVEGDRRDFYEAETEFRLIVREGLLPGIRKKLKSAGTQINRTLSADPAGPGAGSAGTLNPEEAREIRRRLRAASNLHKKLDGILASRLLDHFL